MAEGRAEGRASARHELRDTAPVARLPLQTLTLADCYAHVGTQDPEIVLSYLLLQYNELVAEHMALADLHWSVADPGAGPQDRSTQPQADMIGLGVEGVPTSPPASSRFRLLRRRSTRNTRDATPSAYPRPSSVQQSTTSPDLLSSPQLDTPTAGSFASQQLNSIDSHAVENAKRDVFQNQAALSPRLSAASSSTPNRSSTAPKLPSSSQSPPSLWRKTQTSVPVPMAARQRDPNHSKEPSKSGLSRSYESGISDTLSNIGSLSVSPRMQRPPLHGNGTRVPASPSSATIPISQNQPGSPMPRRQPELPLQGSAVSEPRMPFAASFDRDAIGRASSVHVVHSWISSADTLAFHLLVKPSGPETPRAYLIEKTYVDLMQVVDRLRSRAANQAEAAHWLPQMQLDSELFERKTTPWRILERNSTIESWIHTLQKLPGWAEEIMVQFLSSNVVIDASIPETSPTLGPSLRHAYFLVKRTNISVWEWRGCSLHPNMLYLQSPESTASPFSVQLPYARIRRLYEEPARHRAQESRLRCAMVTLQPSGGNTVTIAMESTEECNEWLQALLLQSHEAQDPIVRPFRTPEPQVRITDLPSTPRIPPNATTPRTDSTASPIDRSDSTSPGLGLEPRLRHGISGLFRTSLNSDHPPMYPAHTHDRRRFWHGLLGMGQPQGHFPLEPNSFSSGSEVGVFGVPLPIAVQEFGLPVDASGTLSRIPAVVKRCVDYLERTHGIEEEGIYRISGSSSAVKALADCFTTMHDVDLDADNAKISSLISDPHNLSSLLKMYLRALPENLCASMLSDMAQAAEISDRSERVTLLARLLTQLPPENYSLLRFLYAHLHRVDSASEKNKMNAHNLGIVLSPTLAISAPLFMALLTDYHAIFTSSPQIPTTNERDPETSPESDTSSPKTHTVESPRDRMQALYLRSPRSLTQTLFGTHDAQRSVTNNQNP
ncbi:Rho GTPase activating protein [Malassezia yamatoensis]|uniref:Rho GTPase activating protein n=1 Tax=Malassezia yamatoensis TaxID=253288 RepID=A0AAJ5YXD7_9BASI|nr:Rho GTPase activating protein [Malassezia yamatoensis]